MKIRTAVIFAGLAAIAVVAALAAAPRVMTAAMFDAAPRTPSDQAMIAHWEQHRKTLDQITEMLRRDPALNRLGLDWSDPDDTARAHVPPERIADYRDLMREASIISISRGHRSVQFLFHAGGPSASSFAKSFVRGEASRHADVIDSDLDEAAAGRPKVLLQRPIADGWWLQRDGS